jgi:hypothetical protein
MLMERIDAEKLKRFVGGRLRPENLPPSVYESAISKLVRDYTGTSLPEDDILYLGRAYEECGKALKLSLGEPTRVSEEPARLGQVDAAETH